MSIEQKMVPLSSTQEGIFVDQMLNPEMASYNIGAKLRLSTAKQGDFDFDLLKVALARLAHRHDALRTILVQQQTGVVQQVLPEVDVAPAFIDVSNDTTTNAEDVAQALLAEQFNLPFDLFGGLLWRAHIVKVSPQRCYLLLYFHHLVVDGFCGTLIVKSLSEIWNQLCQGNLDELPTGFDYLDFVADDSAYQASNRCRLDSEYWQQQFPRLPQPLLPLTALYRLPLWSS